jgi:hypothetical protein
MPLGQTWQLQTNTMSALALDAVEFSERDRVRFLSKIGVPNARGCRLWLGATRSNEKKKLFYGVFCANRKKYKTNRVAYALFVGPISEGVLILHTCDVPLCVDEEHLYPGDDAQNARDKVIRGRQNDVRGDAHWTRSSPELLLRGESNSNAKLTRKEVRTIRALRASGKTQASVARQFKISRRQVVRIEKRESWKK